MTCTNTPIPLDLIGTPIQGPSGNYIGNRALLIYPTRNAAVKDAPSLKSGQEIEIKVDENHEGRKTRNLLIDGVLHFQYVDDLVENAKLAFTSLPEAQLLIDSLTENQEIEIVNSGTRKLYKKVGNSLLYVKDLLTSFTSGSVSTREEWTSIPEVAGESVEDTKNINAQAAAAGNRDEYLRAYIQRAFFDLGTVLTVADSAAQRTKKIQDALNAVGASPAGGTVVMPAGEFIISDELKVPSGVSFRGTGMHFTTIKAANTLASDKNVITTSNNTRGFHSNYVYDVEISDMTVNATWQTRPSSESSNQGCCVKLVTAQRSYIRRVRGLYGILHCLDIAASNYWDDGSTSSQPLGPSLWCGIEDCYAENPRNDDGITTHNSGFLNIERCHSIFDRSSGLPGSSQQGIEVDEGSYNVKVKDCYVKGWTKGYQAKGHTTTRPASDVTFDTCVADACSFGFEFSTGTIDSQEVNPIAKNGRMINCSVINMEPSTITSMRVVNVSGWANVDIDNLTISNTKTAVIGTGGYFGRININGLTVLTASEGSGDTRGIIQFYATARGTVSVRNAYSHVPQNVPMFRSSGSSLVVNIDGIHCDSNADTLPMVWFPYNNENNSYVVNLSGNRKCWIAPDGGRSPVEYVEYKNRAFHYVIGYGSPEGTVEAKQGSVCTTRLNHRIFRKDSGGTVLPWTNTGWKEIST